MRHDFFSPQLESTYNVAILVPDLRMTEIKTEYVDPSALPETDFLALSLHKYPGKKKTSASEIKEYITQELAPVLDERDVKVLLVGDSDYFKVLTKLAKAEPYLGYAVDSVFGSWKVVYVPSYRTVFYDPPKIRQKIQMGLKAMDGIVQGTYADPGEGIIQTGLYPRGVDEIQQFLQDLLDRDCDLTSDIEAFSLKHYDAGIGSIAFAWNQGEGGAFLVDLLEDQTRGFNAPVRELLKAFFIELHSRGRHVKWHNIGYDVYVLIYQLFMSDILDIDGLYEGMYYLLSDWDCTKLVTYLATNSCAGNELGLKAQTREFAGNYAEDEIADIRKIQFQQLLTYNLKDALSTWHAFNKHWPTLVQDQQENIYVELFKPAMMDIIQMQLTGLPVNMDRVVEVKSILEKDEADALARIKGSILVEEFVYDAQVDWMRQKNATLKKKRVTLADVGDKVDFNPNSPQQLVALLYTRLGLPVLDVTDTGQPSAGGETLEALLNHTKDPKVLALLQALLDFKAVNKLVTSFIPALLNAQRGPDGWHYLFGNFNLGGTVSGRLSSSNPNLQNLPAANGEPNDKKTIYAKLIKSCFQAPPGWLFCGLDFDSLEDRISALTTKDPMKLAIYVEGFDGHALRAQNYFSERMPDIEFAEENTTCYKAKVGGTDVYFHAQEQITYLGQTMTGQDLYELLANP